MYWTPYKRVCTTSKIRGVGIKLYFVSSLRELFPGTQAHGWLTEEGNERAPSFLSFVWCHLTGSSTLRCTDVFAVQKCGAFYTCFVSIVLPTWFPLPRRLFCPGFLAKFVFPGTHLPSLGISIFLLDEGHLSFSDTQPVYNICGSSHDR